MCDPTVVCYKQKRIKHRLLVKPEMKTDSFLDIDGLLEYIILGDKTETCLCVPIQALLSQFLQKPEILRFGYNRNSYTFMPVDAQHSVHHKSSSY